MYAYGIAGDGCHSIPVLSVSHLGDGLSYNAKRNSDQYRWQILVPDDAQVGDLYDTINSELRGGLRLHLDHLSEPTRRGDTVVSLADIPYEQRRVLKEAVERGYDETPWALTTQELVDELDIPQSTVQYRLSRAGACSRRSSCLK